MHKTTRTIGTLLVLVAISASALADPGRGRGYFPRHAPVRHGGHNWVAPLVFLGLAGAVLGAAASQNNPPPTVYVAPPVTYAPPPVVYAPPPVAYSPPPVVAPAPPTTNAWYFCGSVGKYYPHTPHCPEGWQAVYPPPG